jgi:outer membrane protein OmpA-like peptidoglycan-associated protein
MEKILPEETMMTRTKSALFAAAALFILTAAPLVRAQEADAENCKDHPLLSRMKSFTISECEKRFDAAEFMLADGEGKTVEGQKTKIHYALQENAQRPSLLQIRRNYANAVKAVGGTVLFDGTDNATFRLSKNGKEIWIRVDIWNDGNNYDLTILEVEGMIQEVTADAMYDALSKDGFLALYINFDTGKSDIKPESQGTVGQIAALMEAHPELKLSVEGHTDNAGTPATNKTLSEARARAVMAAVVKAGVGAARLAAVGWGQEKPIADNRSEDGRAKNRRVEIVKK